MSTANAPEQLVWHIICVRGVVEPVLPFVWSLLGRLPGRLRLVANGSTPAETESLRRFAALDPRLECVSLESPTVLKHGEALSRLLEMCTEEWFACIDSDIFCPADWGDAPVFEQAFARLLSTADGIFSCFPIWQEEHEAVLPNRFRWMVGRTGWDAAGAVLGVTYCMLYRAATLRTVLARWDLQLTPYRWTAIPRALQGELAACGQPRAFYDTAKVANLALAIEGAKLQIVKAPGLVHIGAASGNSAPGRRTADLHGRDSLLLGLKKAARRLAGPFYLPVRNQISWAEARQLEKLSLRRAAAQAILSGHPLPAALPTLDRARFVRLGQQIAAVQDAYMQAMATPYASRLSLETSTATHHALP